MNTVLDASVVIQLLFADRFSTQSSLLLDDADRAGSRLVAPIILPAEVINVIRRRMRRDRIPLDEALYALDEFLRLPIGLVGEPSLYREALRLTGAYSLGGHDALYVALAQLLECDLWTDDERVLRAIGGRLPFVRWIGDYVPSSNGST